MTNRRTMSEEKELPLKQTEIVKIELDPDECDIKNEPFEEYDPLHIGHFDSLRTSGNENMTDSLKRLGILTRKTSTSNMQEWNYMTSSLPPQECSITSAPGNLSKMQRTQIDEPGSSTQNVEEDIKLRTPYILSHSIKKASPDEAEVCKNSCVVVPNIINRADKEMSCAFCSYKTIIRTNLKRHLLTHTGEKPFSCGLCSYTTSRKDALKQHNLSHTDEKAFSCEVCSFKANSQGSLNRHITIHTREKSFSCELCSYKTTLRKYLSKHLLTHMGEKTFSCEFCSHKSKRKYCLKQHMYIHMVEGPFSCEFCSFKTSRQVNLNRHILIHTGEKPFSCKLCSFKASRSDGLKEHNLSHTREKGLSCQLCSYKTNSRGHLSTHFNSHRKEAFVTPLSDSLVKFDHI